MNVSLDQVFSLYWERPEYMNGWREAFEVEEHRLLLLKKILRFLPPDWGQLQFLENLPGKRFIVLFTHDYDNDGAGRNEARVLNTLSATGAITFFGAEGATGELDIARFRSFEDRDMVRMVVDYDFQHNNLTPLMHVLLTTPTDFLAWGIEDPDLYEAARDRYLMHAPNYWATVERRAPVLLENLLLKMDEMDVAIAGVILTQCNFSIGHQWLLDHKIAHAGIVSSSQGPTQSGRTYARLREDKELSEPIMQLFQGSPEEERQKKEERREQYNAWRKGLIPNSGVTQWEHIDSGLQSEPYDAAREWKRPADWKRPRGKIITNPLNMFRHQGKAALLAGSLMAAFIVFSGTITGAYTAGLLGAALGFVLSTIATAVAWWGFLLSDKAVREFLKDWKSQKIGMLIALLLLGSAIIIGGNVGGDLGGSIVNQTWRSFGTVIGNILGTDVGVIGFFILSILVLQATSGKEMAISANARGSPPMAVMPAWGVEKVMRLAILITTGSRKWGSNQVIIQAVLDHLLRDTQQLEAPHPDLADTFNDLANLYREQGKYEEAEPVLQQALAIREQQLGTTHLRTADTLNNLGSLYWEQGRYGEAEPLYQRVLAIREQQLGTSHLDTANSLNNLASLYLYQGRYEEARPLHQRALAIREQQLGASHSDTGDSLNNLALVYRAQRKYEEAEPLLQRALAIREQELGATHSRTAETLCNLGGLYWEQGRHGEAEPVLLRALAIAEQELRASHPDTADILTNLALVYQAQGRYREARPLYQRALAIREQQLGASHPRTADILNNLASLYWEQGRYREARSLLRRALAIAEQQLGRKHPKTQTIREHYLTLRRLT